MLTAKAQENDVERGFQLGADDYVVKPFSPRELVRRVTAVLSRRQSALPAGCAGIRYALVYHRPAAARCHRDRLGARLLPAAGDRGQPVRAGVPGRPPGASGTAG